MAATATAAAGGSSPGDEEGGLGLPDEDEGVVVVEDTVQDTRWVCARLGVTPGRHFLLYHIATVRCVGIGKFSSMLRVHAS